MIEELLDSVDWDKIVDETVDLVSKWASNVWNWLKNFFAYVYEHIGEWFQIISQWFDEALAELEREGYDTTGIITNPAYETGRKIIDILRNADDGRISLGANGNVAMTMADENIRQVATFNANKIDNPQSFDALMRERDGVIVIKN